MPAQSEKIQQLKEQTPEGEIPYFSKSRIKTYKTCPRKFYYTYIEGKRPDETDAMRQGTRIHEVFEDYYENVGEHFQRREGEKIPNFPPSPRELSEMLPDKVLRWADWYEFMGNFLAWECMRAEYALASQENIEDAIEIWLPCGVEEECWKETCDPSWMGFADVIIHASTVPEIEDDSGVVIVDFKTGKTPDKRYRDDGIYLEGEYYGMVFDDEYEVAGVAGFYPKAGDFLVTDLSKERRDTIEEIVEKINSAVNSKDGASKEKFPIEPQPLCKWGDGEENECDFYRECESSWGEPARRREVFEQMIENGNSDGQIAGYFDCGIGAVRYWKSKFNL